MVDLREGIDSRPVTVGLSGSPGMALVNVLADGDLVLASTTPGTILKMSIVDRGTGAEERRVRIDLASHLFDVRGKHRHDLAAAIDADIVPR